MDGVLPVAEVVDCAEGVAGAGQAAAGAVGEVSVLAVVTLQTAVARQTHTLTRTLVALVRVQDPLGTAAAVAHSIWGGGHNKQFQIRMGCYGPVPLKLEPITALVSSGYSSNHKQVNRRLTGWTVLNH